MSETKDILPEITIPPLEIRTLIGKTAIYVNKNGVAFENKIKTKEHNNPKFIFLNSKDPYNAYYKYVLENIRLTGKIPEIKQSNAVVLNDEKNDDFEANVIVSIEEPEQYKFLKFENRALFYAEDKISKIDLGIIKLTAQFAVVNGKKVLNDFKDKVLNNSRLAVQFAFLRESHSMNKIFQKYSNIYDLIITKKQEMISEYGKKLDQTDLLNNCFRRAEYLENESKNMNKIEEKKLLERIKYGSIDWQDFTIVETITFTDMDEVAELNKPLNKSDLEYRSLVQKEGNDVFADDEDYTDKKLAEDFEEEGEDDEGVPNYQDDESDDGVDGRGKTDRKEEVEEEKEINRRRVPKGIKVKSAGESRLLKRRYQQIENTENVIDPLNKEKLFTCPLTGKLIPESQFQTHISTLLRDPKYQEEKSRYEAKFKYGSSLSTEQVYENIKSLVNEPSTKKSKI